MPPPFLISICETSLDDSVYLTETLHDDYTLYNGTPGTFVPANHRTHLCLLITGRTLDVVACDFSLIILSPLLSEMTFDESIVIELKFGRSPSFDHISLEFQALLLNFGIMHSKMKAENPFAIFLLEILMQVISWWWW